MAEGAGSSRLVFHHPPSTLRCPSIFFWILRRRVDKVEVSESEGELYDQRIL